MADKQRQPITIKRDETPAYIANTWATMAYTLVLSANILYQKYESWREGTGDKSYAQIPSGGLYYEVSINIILMLYGLAIENLAKGLLVAKGMEPFVTLPKERAGITDLDETEIAISIVTNEIRRNLNVDLNTHDLNLLFSKAGISRTPEDEQLLVFLRDVIESGRYPIAKDAKLRQVVFPYCESYSYQVIRQHIMIMLNKVNSQLYAKGWGNKAIDLETLGVDSHD